MVCAQGYFSNRECALEEVLRLAIFALLGGNHRQVVEGDGVIDMIYTKARLSRGFELLRFDKRRGMIASRIKLVEVFEHRAEIIRCAIGGVRRLP